jgi:citrate lyase subunit beta/citryl-CoA lyase
MGLQLGVGDLKAATGLEPATSRLGPVRTIISMAAAEFGLAALDSAFVNIADMEGFEADAREAKALGFGGKSCIHPSQVVNCNAVFLPSSAEIERARALILAYDAAVSEGRGALTFRGQLVDSVHAQEARALLILAGGEPVSG